MRQERLGTCALFSKNQASPLKTTYHVSYTNVHSEQVDTSQSKSVSKCITVELEHKMGSTKRNRGLHCNRIKV